MPNMQCIAKAKILKREICAVIQKQQNTLDNDVTILGNTTMVVKSTDEKDGDVPQSITLQEIVDQFGSILGQGDKLDLPGEVADDVTFTLRQVYFKKVTDNIPEIDQLTRMKVGDTDTYEDITIDQTHVTKARDAGKAAQPSEYALWLDVNLSELTEGWPIEIESLSIKAWNTNNQTVLEEMGINEMQRLLSDAA